jgi:transaldolase
MATPLQALAQAGQSAWVDLLSRPFVRDGELAALIERGIVGLTSNPSIFQKAIADGDAYDEQLRGLFNHETDPKEIFLALASVDVRDACDLLRNVFDRGDQTRDGWVSLEVDPNLAQTRRRRSRRRDGCTR